LVSVTVALLAGALVRALLTFFAGVLATGLATGLAAVLAGVLAAVLAGLTAAVLTAGLACALLDLGLAACSDAELGVGLSSVAESMDMATESGMVGAVVVLTGTLNAPFTARDQSSIPSFLPI